VNGLEQSFPLIISVMPRLSLGYLLEARFADSACAHGPWRIGLLEDWSQRMPNPVFGHLLEDGKTLNRYRGKQGISPYLTLLRAGGGLSALSL